MTEIYRLDPTLKVKPNQLQAAIAKQVRLLQIQGVKTNAAGKLGWYVVLDKDVVRAVGKSGLVGQALANELVQAVRTVQDLQRLDLARADRFGRAMGGAATALGAVLMVWNYGKLLEDVDNAMSHEMQEARAKLWLGRLAIAGFAAEQLGLMLEKLGQNRLRNALGLSAIKFGRALAFLGRVLSFGVGLILGVWDVWKGIDSKAKGDHGMAVAYGLSGIAGITVSVTLFLVAMKSVALGPIGWLVLLLALMVWAASVYLVETLQDNPRQEWLYRCYFGTAPQSEKYPDAATQAEQFKRAMAH
jgi:hypothetical protein